MKNYFTSPERLPAFRLFLLSICCLSISSFLSISTAQAQLEGNYTIGGADGDGDYASFTEAVQALEAHGVSGPVSFKVRPGAYHEQLRIPPFAGSSCENTLTFESESGRPNEVFLNPHSVEGAVVQITGANGIKIRNLNIAAATTSSMVEVRDGSDCIKLENNIIRGNIRIQESSNQVIIEQNIIEGSIRALSGKGDMSSHGHIYRNNELTEGIIKEKIGEFMPDDPDFDEGLEIIGNIVPRGIVLSGQKGIRLNLNTIAVPEETYEGAGISLTNCWYGQELMGNTIDIKSHRGLARGIEAVNGIPERVSENRITLREGRVLTVPGTKPATPGFGGGTAIRFSTGPTANNEVLLANNIIDVSGSDYREQLRTLIGIHITDATPQTNAIRFYHNSIHVHGHIDAGIPIGVLAEPLPPNLLHLINNLILLDAINSLGQHVQGDPLRSKSNDVVAVWEHNYEIYDIGEHESIKGTYLAEVPKDFYGQLRADPPFVGAVEGSAPEEPEPPSPGEPLAGSYTIGGQDADFTNFREAMEALDKRGKSSEELIFRIRPGTYTEQVHIHSAEGLVFEGEAGDSTAVVLQYFGAPVVNVDRSHVTFRNMTISGTGWIVVNIGNDVSHFRMERNIIQGTRGSRLVSSYTLPEGQSNHHSYEKNLFSGGGVGLHKTHGMDAWHFDRRDNHLIIKDNLFQGQTQNGIMLVMQNDVVIENNRILLQGSETGILIQFSTNVRKVNDNEINTEGGWGLSFDGSQPSEILRNKITLTGPGTGMYIDYHANINPVMIANNMLSVKAGPLTNNRNNDGIYINSLRDASIYFNSVHVYGQEERSAAIRIQSPENISRMANNILSNTAGGPALGIRDIESVDWANHNAYYHSGDSIRLGQQDIFAEPGFLADDNLIPTNSLLESAGIAITGIETDLFGNLRNDPPDIGAVEFEAAPEAPADALSGTYTIGGDDADFASFSEAVATLKEKGVKSSVTFQVMSGTYTERVIIEKVPGCSCENPIVFESASGENDAVFITDSSTDFVLQIKGVDGISIRNLNISGSGTLVDIREGADCISLENNILTGATTAEAEGTLVNSASGSNYTGDHHTFTGNTFIGGRNGLRKANDSASPGATQILDKGLVVMDNEFRDQNSGISLRGQESYRINRNKIQSNRMFASGITSVNSFHGKEVSGNVMLLPFGDVGIYFYGGIPERVTENRVIMTELGDRHYEATGIGLEAGGSDSQREMLVANNLIKISYNFSYEPNEPYTQGMNISGTAKVYHNSILLSAPGNSTAFYGYGDLHVFNNTISTFWDASIVSTNAVAMDYNNLYSLYGGFNLSDWQSSTGRDMHSISVRPGEDLLHPDFKDAGTYLEEVPTDIAGQPRNNPPSIGAIELGADPDHTHRTFTIGGENGDYTSFSEAIRDIPFLDGRDSIFFQVRPGIYHEQVKLDTSYYSHVAFEGESRDSTDVVLEYANDYAVRIHNASGYTFRFMTISGKGAVHIEAEKNGTSAYLAFENNILRSLSAAAAVYTHTQTVWEYRRNSVSFLSFKNNFITGEGWGIHKEGLAGRHQNGGPVFIPDKGLEIIGNIIHTGLSGIKVGPTVGATINYNTLRVEGTTTSSREGISLTTITDLLEVKGNQVMVKGTEAEGITIAHYYPDSDDLSQPRQVINNKIILPDGGTGLLFNMDHNPHPVLVANNMISVNGNEGSVGIHLKESSSPSEFYFNSILIYGEDSQSMMLRFSDSSPNILFANNIFTNSAGGSIIYSSNNWSPNTDNLASSDYNNFFTSGNLFGHWHGTEVQTLADWQSVTGLDENSLSADPQFESAEPLIPTNPALAGAGIALETVSTDFFGNERNDPPTIGAVEMEDSGEIVAVIPILECVIRNRDGSYTATFGYDNPNSKTIDIAVGAENRLNLMEYAGQPGSFAPGRHERVFHVVFETSASLSWTLGNTTVTADRHSPGCNLSVQPVVPMVACASQLNRTTYMAKVGYHNPNEQPVAIAAGRLNRLFGPHEQGQPTVFEPGHHPEVFYATYSGTFMWNLGSERVMTNSGTPDCSPALQTVQPLLDCVSENADGTFTAHFGYNNPNPVTVIASLTLHNHLFPAFPGGDELPTIFEPGRHEMVFSVPLKGQRLEWRLMGNTVRATQSAALACNNTAARMANGEVLFIDEHRNELLVYPNFFDKVVNIYLAGGEQEQMLFRVYSLTGRLVAEEAAGSRGQEPVMLNLQHLAQGAYILEINTGENSRSFRIFKQH